MDPLHRTPSAKVAGADADLRHNNANAKQTNTAAKKNLSELYKLNLFCIGVVGVLVCWWIYYFTDYFEAFSSLLALGGIFSWLTFVTKILPETRLQGLQESVDETLTRSKVW